MAPKEHKLFIRDNSLQPIITTIRTQCFAYLIHITMFFVMYKMPLHTYCTRQAVWHPDIIAQHTQFSTSQITFLTFYFPPEDLRHLLVAPSSGERRWVYAPRRWRHCPQIWWRRLHLHWLSAGWCLCQPRMQTNHYNGMEYIVHGSKIWLLCKK